MQNNQPLLGQLLSNRKIVIAASIFICISIIISLFGIIGAAQQPANSQIAAPSPTTENLSSPQKISNPNTGLRNSTTSGVIPSTNETNLDAEAPVVTPAIPTTVNTSRSKKEPWSVTSFINQTARNVQKGAETVWKNVQKVFGISPANDKTTAENSSSGTPSEVSANGATQSTESGNQIVIPASATVLTLNGLDFNITNYVQEQFHGYFKNSPYRAVKINYPASFAMNSITAGVANLDAALKSTPGQKIVLAHSQGAQVASRWMREHASDSSAPRPSELTFILTGNPLRSNGNGYIVGRTEVGGTTGTPTPTDTPWHIIDFARRYDGWADWPNDTSNIEAVSNAGMGKFTYHSRYDVVNFYDDSHTIWTKGNTTYVLTHEAMFPSWQWNTAIPESTVSVMKARIESAYIRPINDPPVKVTAPSDRNWYTQMERWGISPN